MNSVILSFVLHLQIPPIKAVLGGFKKASSGVRNKEPGQTNLVCEQSVDNKSDLVQFGQLLAVLMGHCNGSSEYTEVSTRKFL